MFEKTRKLCSIEAKSCAQLQAKKFRKYKDKRKYKGAMQLQHAHASSALYCLQEKAVLQSNVAGCMTGACMCSTVKSRL